MRIAAVLSGDQNLKDAFMKYGDVHSMTACAIFNRNMPIEEFMSKKHDSPYKEQRVIAKTTNFQFLFGGSSWSFSNDCLRRDWNDEYCQKFVDDMHLDILEDSDMYYTAGEYIRSSFFEKYPDLELWHERCHKEAELTGKVQSSYGARRLLPKLTYIGKDSDKKIITNNHNLSKNSVVQTFEAVTIHRSMRELHQFIKDNNMKSRIFGMIHDSVDMYIKRDELDILSKKITEIFERPQPQFDGVTMSFELEVSDGAKGEVWGFGHEVEK